MWDALTLPPPAGITELEDATHALGFTMWSDPLTLSLLRMLAATKVAGQFLELGTGTGISASWIRDGMDMQSQLTTVDHHEEAKRRPHGNSRPSISQSSSCPDTEDLRKSHPPEN